MTQFIYLVIVLVLALWFKKTVEKKYPGDQVSQDRLAQKEKIFAWLLSLANPVITGIVLYYGWKKRLPAKAKQANQITLWVFLIYIVLAVIYIFTFSH